MRRCPACNHSNDDDARYCDHCGAALAQALDEQPQGKKSSLLERLALVIGSVPDADFRIEDSAVSSYHALVLLDAEDVRLLDLGSTNGTFVEGNRIAPDARGIPILSSSSITLGPVRVSASELFSRLQSASPAYLVGREAGADLPIDAPMISTRHLLAINTAAREDRGERQGRVDLRIIDLRSRNGTFRSAKGETHQQRLTVPTVVALDDILHLGSYRLPVALMMAQMRGVQAVPLLPTLNAPSPSPVLSGPNRSPSPVQLREQPLVLGRDSTCDVVLPFVQVSARHARLTPQPDGSCLVEDLGSTNGTFVDGARVSRCEFKPGSTLSLGSHPVKVDLAARTVQAIQIQGAVRLDAVEVARVVRHRETGKDVALVDRVSVSIYPSELVGLMGPSGAGKTTLMQALNGYEPPSSGRVLINGEDLYANYDRFRTLIGYVPQDDIMHRELTVGEALYYSARLRLPPDTTETEIELKVCRVLEELKLVEQRHLLIGSPEQKVLSGGQRKRVNLAMELVTDPVILFLDEPTSGLSARDTADVMEVLRELADGGRTIVITIHQPSPQVFARMDHVIQMARGGKLAFFGPTEPDSYAYFEVTDRSPDKIMDRLEARTPEEWKALYAGSSHHKTYVVERQAGIPGGDVQHGAGELRPPSLMRPPPPLLHQGWILLRRYAKMKLRDRTNLAFMLAQAPLVGLLLALAFHGADNSVLERGLPLFIMCLAVIFFGCANACREIVSERAIYRRERMTNLKIAPYVLSKCIVLGLIGFAQAAVLFAITTHWVGFEGASLDFVLTLSLASLAATALGLLISSTVKSSEAAMATVPIVLVFQIMLSGFLLPLQKEGKEYLEVMAAPMVARWATEALLEVERQGLEGPEQSLWQTELMDKNDLTAKRYRFDMSILGSFVGIFLAFCFALVKRQDGRG